MTWWWTQIYDICYNVTTRILTVNRPISCGAEVICSMIILWTRPIHICGGGTGTLWWFLVLNSSFPSVLTHDSVIPYYNGSINNSLTIITSCAGGRHNVPRPLQLDLLTLKVVSESRVTCATCVPNFVFLGLSVLDLGQMYATDRRQTCIIA